MRIEDESMLDRFRGPGACGWCKKMCHHREPHHAKPKGIGGASRLDIAINILPLGSTQGWECHCHSLIHDGKISAGDVWEKIAERENTTRNAIQQAIWWFMRMPAEMSDDFLAAEKSLMDEPVRHLIERALSERTEIAPKRRTRDA